MSDYQFKAEYGSYGSSNYVYDNVVTVVTTVPGTASYPQKRLNKTIRMVDGKVKADAYDNAYLVNLHAIDVADLRGVWLLVRHYMDDKYSCFVRAVPIDPSRCRRVRRLIKPDGNYLPTLVEHRLNWFVIDVDGYGVATGDVLADARTVLLGLPKAFHDIECVALASARYRAGGAIRMHLLFWNKEQITGTDLTKYFKKCEKFVDLAQFAPNQIIYIATADFVGVDDPLAGMDRLVFVQGCTKESDIKHDGNVGYLGEGVEDWCDKDEADRRMPWIIQDLLDVVHGKGRNWELWYQSRRAGKLVAQGHFEEKLVFDLLDMACDSWPDRNARKDRDTIQRGLDDGKEDMGNV